MPNLSIKSSIMFLPRKQNNTFISHRNTAIGFVGRNQKGNLGEYLLCIDESQHFRLDKNATIHKMLRESRKYSVAMILSTQFVGGIKDRDVRLVMEQAAQKVYFRPPESSIPVIARSIDYETRFKWRQILNELQTFEYVFRGNGIVDGKAYDLKCKLKFK